MKTRAWLKRNGQGLVEYGLIVALIAVVCLMVTNRLGKRVETVVSDANDAIKEGSPRRTRTGWDRR